MITLHQKMLGTVISKHMTESIFSIEAWQPHLQYPAAGLSLLINLALKKTRTILIMKLSRSLHEWAVLCHVDLLTLQTFPFLVIFSPHFILQHWCVLRTHKTTEICFELRSYADLYQLKIWTTVSPHSFPAWSIILLGCKQLLELP